MNNHQNQVITALSGKRSARTHSIYCVIGFPNGTL